MQTLTEKPTIVKYRQEEFGGYLLKYTLYEEVADKEELYDMLGEKALFYDSFYSVKIETVSLKNTKDRVETILPKMTVEKDKAVELLEFLNENYITAEGAYDSLPDIVKTVGI